MWEAVHKAVPQEYMPPVFVSMCVYVAYAGSFVRFLAQRALQCDSPRSGTQPVPTLPAGPCRLLCRTRRQTLTRRSLSPADASQLCIAHHAHSCIRIQSRRTQTLTAERGHRRKRRHTVWSGGRGGIADPVSPHYVGAGGGAVGAAAAARAGVVPHCHCVGLVCDWHSHHWCDGGCADH